MPEPGTSSKRKRNQDAVDGEPTAGSSRKKTQPKAPSKKVDSPTTLYKESIEAIETTIKALDKKVSSVDTDHYAKASTEHIPAVKKLGEKDGGMALAFNLMMAVADSSHADLDVKAKMCGYGGSEEPFHRLDEVLLSLIERREKPATRLETLPKVPNRWSYGDSDVGPYKTGQPNKQQRNQIARQRIDWEKERRGERRDRREREEDWVAVALSDLKEERDYLDAYGVEEYFPKSIARLEELMGAKQTDGGAEDTEGDVPAVQVEG